ncbi:sensor histidine kinase [Abditibacterium utsteinense]|uniref:sensor histidine kinase n=1 Tax=Abditibacterium utsteinense TaxID=1960156 RepID=UPI0013004C45|nr:HAMP domain-containing sensor histidine kinase [Abditibacterium utsteinense]
MSGVPNARHGPGRCAATFGAPLSFPSGEYQVVLGVPWRQTQQEIGERTRLLGALSFLVVLAGAGGAWILVGRTLSPIDHLAEQAGAASVESLRLQLQAPSPDAEIHRLVATLNDLLAHLGESAAARGRFYAAASHELRTPLQGLTGHLELELSRPREEADYRLALGEAYSQAKRLTSLVQDLLLLNQLDSQICTALGVLLDLADMCVSGWSPLRELAARRGIEIEWDLPETCEIVAPWNHVTMIVRNLLENAVKHAPSGTLARVQVSYPKLVICNPYLDTPGWDEDPDFRAVFPPRRLA